MKKLEDTKILLGFEVGTGKEVNMNLHHTVITGMSQLSGKTTTLEAIISRANRCAIAFKTKRGESGFSKYHETIPFFEERADWQYVSTLLEAVMREKMRFERPWIMKATQGTRNLREVLNNVQTLRAETKNQLSENIYTALEEYLKIVVPQIDRFRFARTLNLIDGINVMDLTEMSVELQSLVIQSTMERVINSLQETILIVPEAWEHIPQSRNTPVKLYAETFIRKGAAVGNYLFIDSQDIAGVDKTVLRQCNNWILGRQREEHEVDRVREQIGKAKVDAEEIRSLPLGHFIAILGDEVSRVYVLPSGVPQDMGRRVALGEIEANEVGKYMNQARESSLQPPVQAEMHESRAPNTDKRLEEHEAKLTRHDSEVQQLLCEVDGLGKKLNAITAKLEQLEKQLATPKQQAQKSQIPEIQPSFGVDDLNQLIDHRIQQIIKFDKPTIFTSVDVSGSFREIIKDRFVREVGANIRAFPREVARVAMILHERKNIKRGELHSLLHGGSERISDDFYRDLQQLEEVHIAVSSKETGAVHWALGEYLKRQLGGMYDEDTIKKAEEYLSSLLLPTN